MPAFISVHNLESTFSASQWNGTRANVPLTPISEVIARVISSVVAVRSFKLKLVVARKLIPLRSTEKGLANAKFLDHCSNLIVVGVYLGRSVLKEEEIVA